MGYLISIRLLIGLSPLMSQGENGLHLCDCYFCCVLIPAKVTGSVRKLSQDKWLIGNTNAKQKVENLFYHVTLAGK